MKESIKLRLMFFIAILYLIVFGIWSIMIKNFEFLYYILLMFVVLILIVKYRKKFKISVPAISGLTLLGFLSAFGGVVYIGGTRIFDIWIIPNILKYDNVIHFCASLVLAVMIFDYFYPHLDKELKQNTFVVICMFTLLALGIGAFYEIFELIAVLFLNAAEGVGGYLNNAFDLVFNTLGALTGTLIMHKKK